MTARLFLLPLCLLFLACPASNPAPAPTPTATPSSSGSPAPSPTSAADEQYQLRLSAGASPGWFEVRWQPDGKVQLAWEGGDLAYQLSPRGNIPLGESAAAAKESLATYQSPDIPPYRTLTYRQGEQVKEVRLGDEVPGPLADFVERMTGLLPSQRGIGDGYAVGTVKYQDLEGGFYQLVTEDGATLVLQGEVPSELKEKQVMAAGNVVNAPSLQMSGPGLEMTDIDIWPPEGGFWQGENVPKELLP